MVKLSFYCLGLSAQFMDLVQIGIISNGYYNTARKHEKFQPRKLLLSSMCSIIL